MKAELLFDDRVLYPDGSFTEIVIWRVPRRISPSKHSYKYRMVYIVDGERVLGYDNERGKGDHQHRGHSERPVNFTSLHNLLEAFAAEVEEIRGDK